MALKYEIIENGKGYYILEDNKRIWKQVDPLIPYPGSTIEESAQNHVNAIIADNEAQPSTPTTEEQIQELMLAVAELASSSEQNKLETQLAIAELAATLNGGVA